MMGDNGPAWYVVNSKGAVVSPGYSDRFDAERCCGALDFATRMLFDGYKIPTARA